MWLVFGTIAVGVSAVEVGEMLRILVRKGGGHGGGRGDMGLVV